jgi:hypothetical protein
MMDERGGPSWQTTHVADPWLMVWRILIIYHVTMRRLARVATLAAVRLGSLKIPVHHHSKVNQKVHNKPEFWWVETGTF